MTNIINICKIHFLNVSGINRIRYSKDPKEKNKSILFLVMMVFCGVVICGVSFMYSYMMASGFEQIGRVELLPGIMMAATCLVTLFTTIYKSSGILFGFRDFDLLMSLPIKTGTIVASRVLILYGMNIAFTLLLMVPAGAVYVMKASPAAMFYPAYLILILLLPLIPIILATVVGTLVSIIASRFKGKNMASIVLMILFLAAVIVVSYNMGNFMPNFADIGQSIMDVVVRIYPMVSLFIEAIAGYNWISFLLFILISAAPFAIYVLVISKIFKKVNTALTTNKSNANYRLTELKTSSAPRALFGKEMRRFIASPLYVLNTLAGIILLVIAAVALQFMDVETLAQLTEMPQLSSIISVAAPLFVSFTVSITATTTCSISLEGKQLWILKSIPVDTRSIFKSKMAVNLSIFLPAVLVGCTLIAFGLKLDPVSIVFLYLIPIAFTLFTTILGLLCNLSYPNFNWTNEAAVIKQGQSVVVTMLVGIFSVILTGVILLAVPLNKVLLMTLVTLLLAGAIVLLYRRLMTKGVQQFESFD
ncbi:putative ABC transporter permease subunit [Candidatus Soleaferrea massiliensis]|uniref:putative ABC transporter permease subunit n=1 Tax=Candidatus Soleaferrea massiliensis TaxID=1470354 RepID=UPI00059074BD|nr:hypothetical protein [Candidatus Soleaferrea massiliensis]